MPPVLHWFAKLPRPRRSSGRPYIFPAHLADVFHVQVESLGSRFQWHFLLEALQVRSGTTRRASAACGQSGRTVSASLAAARGTGEATAWPPGGGPAPPSLR